MKFVYKKHKFLLWAAIFIIGGILLYVFRDQLLSINLKESALTKAQQFSDLKKEQQDQIDNQENSKKQRGKDYINSLGNPGNIPNSPSSAENEEILDYDAEDLDVEYHSITPELRGSEKEAKQKKLDVDLKMLNPNPIYYEPGSFPFGSGGYIPSYEDSIYLSRSTKMSQLTPITQAPYIQGGFCIEFAKDNLARNQKCKTLDQSTCASTSCCILVGGTNCVAGDANGPTMKNVFSDISIPNRDFWYHQGKCAGNCP